MLIRGGTIVDGTGSKARRADVRVRGGRIAEIAADLHAESDETVIDAGGAVVTPGFIDCHTHYDAPMFWSPRLDPLPGYGTTTAIMGNCGFSVAPMPVDPASRASIIDVFSYIEDIPRPSFETAVPWAWESWEGYRAAAAGHPTAVNLGALVGHLNLRITAMGLDAWDRAATDAEIAAMAKMLDDALRAGAFGVSTNFENIDNRGIPLPTFMADDREFEALFDVIARHPGRIVQFDNKDELEPGLVSTERMARLAKPRGIRLQFLKIATELRCSKQFGIQYEQYQRLKHDGIDIWPCFTHRPPSAALSLDSCIIFHFIALNSWHQVSNQTPRDQKAGLLADPEWRARARAEWDEGIRVGGDLLRDTGRYLLRNSANGHGPINTDLGAVVAQTGTHPMDALADWWLANGLDSTVHISDEPMDLDAVATLARDPTALGGVNDAGAHGQLFCGAGESATLFTNYVRKGLLDLETVVHMLTGRQAEHFSLRDRGTLRPGAIADIAVFDPDRIAQHPERKCFDVPDGNGGHSWRYTREPAPFRLTMVAGVPTFHESTGQTDALPGVLITA